MGIRKYYVLETFGGRNLTTLTARQAGGKAVAHLRNVINHEISGKNFDTAITLEANFRRVQRDAPRAWRKRLLVYWNFYKTLNHPTVRVVITEYKIRGKVAKSEYWVHKSGGRR